MWRCMGGSKNRMLRQLLETKVVGEREPHNHNTTQGMPDVYRRVGASCGQGDLRGACQVAVSEKHGEHARLVSLAAWPAAIGGFYSNVARRRSAEAWLPRVAPARRATWQPQKNGKGRCSLRSGVAVQGNLDAPNCHSR